LTCADAGEKIDLATLDLDNIGAMGLVAEGIHRTHYNSREEETHSGLVDEDFSYTVEPLITDPPTSGQPLYDGHWLWHRLKLLQN